MKKIVSGILILVLAVIVMIEGNPLEQNSSTNTSYDEVITFPADRYPETAAHSTCNR